jgi:hypothetical protein
MSVEKQNFMATRVTSRHVFLYNLTHVACEMDRELPVKNLTLEKFGFRVEGNVQRSLLICCGTGTILPV